MKNLRYTFPLIALVTCLVTPGVGAADIAASFPKPMMAVGRIDMAKLRNVPVVQEAVSDEFGKLQTFSRQIREWTGVDLDSVDRLWIGLQKKDHAVIVMEGDHDIAGIRDSLMAIDKARIVPKEGVPIAVLLPDEKKPGTFNLGAVLDGRVLVVGQPDVTEAFIDVYTGKMQGLGEAQCKQLQPLAKTQFMVHAFILGLKTDDLEKAPFLRGLTHGELRMDVQGDLHVRLGVGVQKPGLLKPIQMLAQGFFDLYGQMDDIRKRDNLIKRQLLENATARIEGDEVVVVSLVQEDVINHLLGQKLTGTH